VALNDAHCHFLSLRFFEALARETHGDSTVSGADVARDLGWDPPASPEALAKRWVCELDKQGVARAALIASVPGDEESVAIAAAQFPGRFVGFFFLDPTAPEAEARARRAYAQLGLRCACLFPALHRYRLDDDRVQRVFEVAADEGGAVFAHCGYLSIEARTRLGLSSSIDLRLGDPLTLAVTAARFPSVPVIVPHFGGGFFTEALMAAESCPSIHFDTSSSNSWIKFVPGLTLSDVFRRALAVVGPERLVFGTDSSFFPRGWRRVIHGSQVALLDELGVSSQTAGKILGGNFDRIFDVPRRPAPAG
jgi:uncharacterized protein